MNLRFGTERRHPELERLICAAMSNQRFATQLVAAPRAALEHSEHGRQLTPAEWALVTSIDGASDIYDFAARLHARVQQR
jgi:hypothetical protein